MHACAASTDEGSLFCFRELQASSASRARRAVMAGAILLALGAVAAVAMIGGEAVKTGHVRMELSDRNEFESSPAWYSSAAAHTAAQPCMRAKGICADVCFDSMQNECNVLVGSTQKRHTALIHPTHGAESGLRR